MKELLFLGDSITDCNHSFEPDNLGFGYVRMIADALNPESVKAKVINKGNDGFTIPAVRRLWKRNCLTLQPDFITILIGINDLAVIKNTGITASAALADFRDNYQSLIDDIRITTDCPVLLMEPFIFPQPAEYASWEPELLKMNRIIQSLAEENHLSFLPLWEKLSAAAKAEGYSFITTDGIHLTEKGHKIIADSWLTHLWK